MNKKLLFLTKQSLYKKIKTKWFVIANAIILVCLLLFANFDKIITSLEGDFTSKNEIVLKENEVISNDELLNTLTNTTSLFELDEYYEYSFTDHIPNKLDEDDEKIYISLNVNDTNYLEIDIVSNEVVDAETKQIFVMAFNEIKTKYLLQDLNISQNEMMLLLSETQLNYITLDEESIDQEKKSEMLFTVVFPLIVLPVFTLTIFVVQMIGAEINEEKTSRSMEIIISNVSATTHFMSKVIAANLFAIIQGVLLFLYAALTVFITYLINLNSNSSSEIFETIKEVLNFSDIFANLGMVIILLTVMSILSILAYSLIAGILASMTVNMEDYQQVQTPIILVTLAGYYLSIFAFAFEGSVILRGLSYVPLLSNFLSPALMASGQIGLIDVLIAIVLLLLFIYVVIKKGMAVYKVGILNYSSDKMWQRMFKAIKENKG